MILKGMHSQGQIVRKRRGEIESTGMLTRRSPAVSYPGCRRAGRNEQSKMQRADDNPVANLAQGWCLEGVQWRQQMTPAVTATDTARCPADAPEEFENTASPFGVSRPRRRDFRRLPCPDLDLKLSTRAAIALRKSNQRLVAVELSGRKATHHSRQRQNAEQSVLRELGWAVSRSLSIDGGRDGA
ncbi:hypothetical protein M407DRAFT_7369 [Tulasnella calospora MUT 4182]|uniref:Uncharacterized protein n=1 Tax=Tulasnella calospora MUT 4182 TaxID=1051891 RepID=A0A0C3L0T4_9AGAM|nr:hypothetical protein M407DRAFT_7369 [Tulasnella calospora MUT 4182]